MRKTRGPRPRQTGYGGVPLKQRLALAEHAAGVDAATDGDRLYFEANPNRRYRVRLLSEAERAQFEILDGPIKPPAGALIAFTAVKSLAPSARIRLVVFGPISAVGSDMPEAEAEAIWEGCANERPNIRQREQKLLAAMRLPGGPLHVTSREA